MGLRSCFSGKNEKVLIISGSCTWQIALEISTALGTSLVVQWLRPPVPTAGGAVPSLVWELRSPHAAGGGERK